MPTGVRPIIGVKWPGCKNIVGSCEAEVHPHPHPQRQLFSDAASHCHPDMQAQCCPIWVFHWRWKSKCLCKVSQFSSIGNSSVFFDTMNARLNKSAGWIQSTGHQFASSDLKLMPESDCISQPTPPHVHIWSRIQKRRRLSSLFDILILCLNHIVPSSPAFKKPPHLFKSSNSKVFRELDSTYNWVQSLFTALSSLTVFALIRRESKTWEINEP